jgi:PadR family transcriptional regulator
VPVSDLVVTPAMQAVVGVLLESPSRQRFGPDRSDARLSAGSMYPALARRENLRWLASDWEDIDPLNEHRPRRRYYGFTPDGVAGARQAMARVPAGACATFRIQPAGGPA